MFLPLIFTYVSTQPLPFFSHLTPDVQHLVVGFVSLSERQQGSGSTLQRGEFGLLWQAGANHGWPEQDALPEGRHKGDITVSWQLFASVSQRSQVFLNRKHFNRRPDGFKNKSIIHKWSTNTWCILHLHAGNHQVGVLHWIFSKLCCPLIQTTQVSDVKSFVTGNSLSLRQAVTRFCESWDFLDASRLLLGWEIPVSAKAPHVGFHTQVLNPAGRLNWQLHQGCQQNDKVLWNLLLDSRV